jgi:hypothetical protein
MISLNYSYNQSVTKAYIIRIPEPRDVDAESAAVCR